MNVAGESVAGYDAIGIIVFVIHMPGDYLRPSMPSWSTRRMTPAGLEPAIPGSVGRCLIHWATGPMGMSLGSDIFLTTPRFYTEMVFVCALCKISVGPPF